MVNPWSSYDPISLPKMMVLTSFASALGLLIFARRKEIQYRLPKPLWVLTLIFSGWLFLALLFSGAPLSQQFWGSFGRNTGFVTYVSLLTILLAAAILSSKDYYRGVIQALIGTALPMTIYCLIQMAGKDPVGWSEFATFGTLGNVNFLSAFIGMTSVACLAITLDSNLNFSIRISIAILAMLDIFIAYSTGSIQGVVIFIAGTMLIGFIRIRYLTTKFQKMLIGLYLVIVSTSIATGILGLVNKGPLAQFLYQPSVLYRADYVHAGWAMTVSKPLFGVGLDSYGDWYREVRGEISTVRTGVDRVSNSAHNIFLDVSSNGGVILGLAFLAIMLFAGWSAVKYLRAEKTFDPYFTAVFSVWFAYQVQALISINQIGVGVWGWVLSGALIGYGSIARRLQEQVNQGGPKTIRHKYRGAQLSAMDSIAAFVGFVIGLLVTAPPLSADVAFRKANLTGNMAQITTATSRLGSTQFHKEMALDFAMRNNLSSETGNLANKLVSEYPRSFFGWRVLSVLTASTPEERQKALVKVKSLDPYNPEIG